MGFFVGYVLYALCFVQDNRDALLITQLYDYIQVVFKAENGSLFCRTEVVTQTTFFFTISE